MSIQRLVLSFALVVPVCFTAVHLANPAQAAPVCGDPCGGSYAAVVRVDLPKTCNCSDFHASVEVCHKSEVSVKIGGTDIGSFSTGESESTCITQAVPPANCVWIRYHFLCIKSFWLGWNCYHLHSSLHSAPATPADCA